MRIYTGMKTYHVVIRNDSDMMRYLWWRQFLVHLGLTEPLTLDFQVRKLLIDAMIELRSDYLSKTELTTCFEDRGESILMSHYTYLP